ncbi:MAG: DUF4959 domain-containing protein [Prevotellaceae bacterium]|jgi:hypothetical protein|nr:DUF4959 domain-containing protein [Prevotellaceae bacterium]
MKKILYLALCLTLVVWYSCKEEGRLDHINDSTPAPAPVTINGIPTSKPGGAVIKYTVPQSKNLLGVKAVYERNGETCETKASLYTDSLTVEGFGDTESREVNLYSVGRNGKLSEPASVWVTPLAPPVLSSTVTMVPGFGGVTINLEGNSSRANLALVVLVDTMGTNDWKPVQTFYTQSPSMTFACRGLEAKEQRVALYIRDRWNNLSDTLVEILTPIEEVKIPKINPSWTNARLPTDTYGSYNNETRYDLSALWDGTEWTETYCCFHAGQFADPMPQHFTINLGRKVVISRFTMFPRTLEIYSGAAPREFELWGTDNPSPNGSFDNWTLLGQWTQLKPSGYGQGLEIGPITDEDLTYFRSGGNYELVPTEMAPDPYITVNYLRFRTISNFTTYGTDASMGNIVLAELTFYGQIKDE